MTDAPIREAGARVLAAFRTEGEALADRLGLGVPEALEALRTQVRRNLATVSLNGAGTDGRAVKWRIRVQLQRGDRPDVVADTDPDKPLDQAGSEVVSGLPAVAGAVADICAAYHVGRELSGLEPETLRHSLKSLRPALSRQGGMAVWRPRYTVSAGATALSDAPRVEAWLARVDVRRET